MNQVRLFVAFDTPAAVKASAMEVIQKLRTANADVGWERDDKMHCTVKFLGETRHDQLEHIVDVLQRFSEEFPPFAIAYRSLGFFPNAREPRVLWIGIEDLHAGLAPLQQSVEQQLVPLGFAAETRRFHPHLTLGRIRSGRNQRQLLATAESITFATEPYVIGSLSLMRSDLRPTGSVYKQEKNFPLIGKSHC